MALNFCNNNSLSAITSIPASITGGNLNLISTQTASSSANLSFTSGIDSTYKEYIFKFINMHPATDTTHFTFNLSIDGGSNYNVTKTSTANRAYHYENGSAGAIQYAAGSDLAQGTGYQYLAWEISNDADSSISGTLHLFDPSNTTFVKHNNRSILNVTALDSMASGALNLITTNTISSGVSSSSFTSNIDSTYDTYLFKFINIHPASDNVRLHFQVSTNGGSSYGVTVTTLSFYAEHPEDNAYTGLGYNSSDDLAQSTSYQNISINSGMGNENDESISAMLFLFSPSNTTFVKHFILTGSFNDSINRAQRPYGAGYFNTTSAINAIDFKMSSGNIDSGVIKMYGLSKS